MATTAEISRRRRRPSFMTSMPLELGGKRFDSALDWFLGKPQKQYSVDRLKLLYSDLVYHVQLDKTSLGRRAAPPSGRSYLSPSKSRLLEQAGGSIGSSAGSSSRTKRPSSISKARDLTTAFRVLSATPALDKEGENGGALETRDSSLVASLALAKALEDDVVKLIRGIGEVVAFGDVPDTALRSDDIFEWFCEKDILSLLVDICKAKPRGEGTTMRGVVWSPLVKAQVLQALSILLSNAQDGPSLYYLLSKNYINDLLKSFLPLRQWTDPALEVMLPEYVRLLKGLSLQLNATPDPMFSFLTVDDSFPLLTSVVAICESKRSDSYSRSTCMNLVVSLMQISDPVVRAWVSNAEAEQKRLSLHLCETIVVRYRRLAKLTLGPVVDPVRSRAIRGQLVDLQEKVDLLNDVFWCGVRTMNVRLCECFLQTVASLLFQNLVGECKLMVVGVVDLDVIPVVEARAQSAAFFLAQLFMSLAYPPMIRMLAVGLFHPVSTTQWVLPTADDSSDDAEEEDEQEEYVLTKALNKIVQAEMYKDDKDQDDKFIANPYRMQLLSVLSGDLGDWLFVPVTMLVEAAMASKGVDTDILVSFDLIPSFDEHTDGYPDSPLENAVATFLNKTHSTKISSVSLTALERAGALSLSILSRIAESVTADSKTQLESIFPSSPLVKAMRAAHVQFCKQAVEAEQKTGVSELVVDLTQSAIASRYSMLSEEHGHHSRYGCLLETFSCREKKLESEVLIRKFRVVGSNDVEDARFSIQLALHYRALCHLVYDLLLRSKQQSTSKRGKALDLTSFGEIDWADDLLLTIADVKEKPLAGTDLDLRGRMTFRFHAGSNRFEQHQLAKAATETETANKERKSPRSLSQDILRPTTYLVLVLDPTDIFVVKPLNRSDVNRGTILCSASLRSIIAFASDGEWLHIAIRNMEDVGFLIKNGNMALRFETEGACLIVRQYLERSQSNLRNELKDKINELFMVPKTPDEPEMTDQDEAILSKRDEGNERQTEEEELPPEVVRV